MWFSAVILLRSEVADRTPADSLWEECIVLVKADSEDEAIAAATAIAKGQEVSYTVDSGAELHWRFDRVAQVCPIDSENLESGTELFSRFLRASEVESLLAPFDD